ncbi:MAG: bacteriohopanetetrol glucosamine biosynthesis glycosyltransferase HpnI [Alphaproteobacteria bacterium]|nr:bacteriohopanetetrol glucosamine biosynthesis glycosyltransferase HpnI [Alphaproteobacteria bacterium]
MQLEWLVFPALVCLAASVAGLLYLAVSAFSVRCLLKRPHRSAESNPVTLLKPLKGADAELYENLRSFCAQDHPRFQVVFGVADADDPAATVVRRLIAEFPGRDLMLVAGGPARVPNRKVANLINMLPAARHRLLVISDSDMRVAPYYAGAIAGSLAALGSGLVTCLYRGVPAASDFWSRIACLHINHGFLPLAAVGEVLRAGDGAFGATLALSRETLEAIGGLAAIADRLADDHALGAAVRHIGLPVALAPVIVDNIIFEPGLAAMFRHELRWARTIRMVAPAGYAGSVITHPLALALLALLLHPAPWSLYGLIGAFLVRIATVWLDDRALGLRLTPFYLIPLRDGLSFAVFVASFFARSVAWRDRRYRVARGGRLTLDGDSPA